MRERIHLREHFSRDWNDNKLPLRKLQLQEGQKVVEAEGKKYDVKAGYEVPIWKLGEKNLNGRTYSQKLGEQVVNEGKKTFNLADHPKEEGSVHDIVAVSMNPHIREGVLYADTFFVDDEFHEKVERILEHGLGLGVSSSAYGELEKDGRVREDTFELERYFDFVLEPSYEVYLTRESEKTSGDQLKSESTTNITNHDDNSTGAEGLKASASTHLEENGIMSKEKTETPNQPNNKPSIEERNLQMGARNLLKEAQNTEDLYEKRRTYEEVLEYCDGQDYAKEYIEEARKGISEIDEQLKELADKGKEADTLKESKQSVEKQLEEAQEENKQLREQLESLTEQHQKACRMLDEGKERDNQLKEMYKTVVAERNGMVSAADYKELHSYAEKKEEEAETLRGENRKLKRKLRRSGAPVQEGEETLSSRRRVKESPEREETETEEDVTATNEQVQEYYEDLLAYNPEVKQIREHILKSRTLMEAQRNYLRYKDLVEDVPKPRSRVYELPEDTPKNGESVSLSNGSKLDEQSGLGKALKARKGWV